MKLATLFRDSYAELKHVRTITTAAMFAAASVVLGMFTIQAGPYLKIGISTLANEFVYLLYGPVVGACYGGILDLVKFIISHRGFLSGVHADGHRRRPSLRGCALRPAGDI